MNERLRDIINYLIFTHRVDNDADLANKLGMYKSNLSEMVSGKRTISQRTLSKLVTKFPMVDRDWLLTGEGNMLKDNNFFADKIGGSVNIGSHIKNNSNNVSGVVEKKQTICSDEFLKDEQKVEIDKLNRIIEEKSQIIEEQRKTIEQQNATISELTQSLREQSNKFFDLINKLK